MPKLKLIFAAVITVLILTLGTFPLAVSAAPANGTGFTAAILATSGQKITGDINATGYDIGIYVGPGIHNVIITGANVFGANNEGILVQDASNIIIKDSTISGNGLAPVPGLTENKAIVLAGTTNSLVKNNIVENNMADGGISLIDDGPNHPFAPDSDTTVPVASRGNVITGNTVQNNLYACGIVVAAKNPGGGVYNNVVSKNTVIGYMAGDPFIPAVGGIVVAGGAFGPVQVVNTVVLNNVVKGGLLPGISLHAFGPGVISGTKLIGNALSNNSAGEPGLSDDTTGIEIFAVPGVGTITGTQVLSDSVSNNHYGVWHIGDTGTHIAHLQTDNVTTPVFP